MTPAAAFASASAFNFAFFLDDLLPIVQCFVSFFAEKRRKQRRRLLALQTVSNTFV